MLKHQFFFHLFLCMKAIFDILLALQCQVLINRALPFWCYFYSLTAFTTSASFTCILFFTLITVAFFSHGFFDSFKYRTALLCEHDCFVKPLYRAVQIGSVTLSETEMHEEMQHFKLLNAILEKRIFPQSLSHADTIMIYMYKRTRWKFCRIFFVICFVWCSTF